MMDDECLVFGDSTFIARHFSLLQNPHPEAELPCDHLIENIPISDGSDTVPVPCRRVEKRFAKDDPL
jgi:hypothetical protein